MSHIAVKQEVPVSPIDGKQASGLVTIGVNDPSELISLGHFFGLVKGGGSPRGADDYMSMNTCYGFQSDTNIETFVYSAKLTAKFVIPRATLTGTLYQGEMRLGQFFNSTALDQSPEISLSALIRAANKVEGMQAGFELQSSLVNDYILTHTVKGTDILDKYLSDESIGSEILSYAVLQTPAINISSGALQTYSLICDIKYNAAVLPSANNLLLYRKFEAISHRKQYKEVDYPYTPVDLNILDRTKKPITYADLIAFDKAVSASTPIASSGVGTSDGLVFEHPYEMQSAISEEVDTDSEHKEGEEEDRPVVTRVISRRQSGAYYTLFLNRKLFSN